MSLQLASTSYEQSPLRSWFRDLKEEDMGVVLLGNDQTCIIRGMGSVALKLADGSLKILSEEVRYIPTLKRNLISLGILEKKGLSFQSKGGVLNICREEKVIMRGIRKQSLYYLEAEVVTGESETISDEDSRLWHLRLGHVSEKGLNELRKQGIIKNSVEFKLTDCEQCILGKSKKLPYGKGVHKATKPLEYIHAYLWGPSRTQTMGRIKGAFDLSDRLIQSILGLIDRF